jgi:epoxyqueuosine reductase
VETSLIQRLEEQGYGGRIVSIRHLRDLQEAIEDGYRQGLLDEAVYREYLVKFTSRPPDGLAEARSLIVVAYPDPQVRLAFHRGGKLFRGTVPPTYLHGQRKDRQAQELLGELVGAEGYRVAPVAVPKKLLAACSGLARYGKNNIAYVEGPGSFHRLAAFCSDLVVEQEEWREPALLDRCARCRICEQACPTGAIEPGRFRLRAERCITFWNEKPGTIPFPAWMAGSWHNCLVGCMRCQHACPENRAVRDRYEEGAEFSDDETALLLEGAPRAGLPAALAEKLQRGDLLELLDLLPRNLKALLAGREGETG